MIEEFLDSVAVIDTEATSNKPDEAQIIELGVSRIENNEWVMNSKLFKPSGSIPAQCSAVCNITDAMVKNSPTFAESINDVFELLNLIDTKYFVAHNAQYDIAVLNFNFKNAGIDFNIERDLGKSSWICTHRLSKRLYADKADVQHGQSFLRYYFQLDLDPNLFPHRAGHDSFVCGHILLKLLEEAIDQGLVDPSKEIGSQLVELSWKKIPTKVWPYGKNKGKKFSELDDGFLRWAILNVNDLDEGSYSYNADLAAAVEEEINNRPNFTV